MNEITVIGIVGSPRINGNTAKLVQTALEAAISIPGVKTELYQMGDKKFHHCIGCYKCYETGACTFKDDLQELARKYIMSDGVILGAPVYHMSVPAVMKAAIERLAHSIICNSLMQGRKMPMFSKVSGAITVGGARYGGQDLVLSFLMSSSLLMNGVVVSGNTLRDNYLGAAAYLGVPGAKKLNRGEWNRNKDTVLNDLEGMAAAAELGKRVAEMTKVVKTGMSILRSELSNEYAYTLDDAYYR